MKKLLVSIILAFASTLGWSQVAVISGQVLSLNGGFVPFAKIRVCSVTSSGTPCNPTVPVYYDYGLNNIATNPTADQYGNYLYYGPALSSPNIYIVQVIPQAGTTWMYAVNGPSISSGGGTLTGPLTDLFGFIGPLTGNVTGNVTGNLTGNVTGNLTGTVTGHSTLDLSLAGGTMSGAITDASGFIGPLTGNVTGNLTGNVTGPSASFSETMQGVQYVTSSFARGGGDVGAELNLAYAALPSSGGKIYLAPKPDGTCYSFTTPIVFAVLGKNVQLEGLGAGGVGATGSTCLNYTPTTSTTAMTLDYASVSGGASGVHGLRNIYLINNGCTTAGGCGSSAVGIDSGHTNDGTIGAIFENLQVAGFGVGYRNVSFSSGGESQSSEIMFIDPWFAYNTKAWVVENPTGLDIYKGFFNANGKAIVGNDANASVEIKLYGTTFSDNATPPIIDFTTNTSPAILYSFGAHFENGNGASEDMNYISGDVSIFSTGDFFENDSTSGGCTQVVGLTGVGAHIVVTGMNANSTQTCPTFASIADSSNSGIISGYARGFTAITTGTYAANISTSTTDNGTTAPLTTVLRPPLFVNTYGALNGFTIQGAPSGGIQESIGSGAGTSPSTIGTISSTSNTFLAFNAAQTTSAVDNWHQIASGTGSSISVYSANGVCFYRAASSTADGTFATFWGTALFCSATSGILVNATTSLFTGTSGTASCSQGLQGTQKYASCYLNGYANTGAAQTWTFSTAFSTTPVLLESGGSCGTYNPSSTATVLTLPANAGMTAETCNVIVLGQ